MVPQALQDRVTAKLVEMHGIANRVYGFNERITVEYASMGTRAGTAHYNQRRIRLNQDLLLRETEEMINHTAPHELAHIVARHVYGKEIDPHGSEWRQVMHAFGLPPDRTHDMDVEDLRQEKQKYEYKCNCRIREVGGKVHNKIMRGWTYTCRQCKGTLHPTGDTPRARLSIHVPPPEVMNQSKAAICRWLYANNSLDSKSMQKLFMDFAGCTKTGAATYYYQIHKK